jgi:uncharacterized protein
MNSEVKTLLVRTAEAWQTKNDPSYDFDHVLRVLNLSVRIGLSEKADTDVLFPAALFHDIIFYEKNDARNKGSSKESAEAAREVLLAIDGFDKNKIEAVVECISQCSFSKGIKPTLLESKILQDADGLEATGAISIMRTFSSGGRMNIPFYCRQDPFCENGPVDFRSSLDLFYTRLLVVESRMHTELAKKMARRRTEFLRSFLDEFKMELSESLVT